LYDSPEKKPEYVTVNIHRDFTYLDGNQNPQSQSQSQASENNNANSNTQSQTIIICQHEKCEVQP